MSIFFASWWQAIIFGIVTTIAMAALCCAFAIKWTKYSGEASSPAPAPDAHHH